MATKVLRGLSRTTPFLAWGGKIKPNEIDEYKQYVILKPSILGSTIVAACSGTALSGTVARNYLDYPRNVRANFIEASGTGWTGTLTVKGKDQFGNVISENIVNAALGTTATNGTKVFAYVGTVTHANTGAAAGDDWSLGYCNIDGTTKFGLPNKISGSADIRFITWLDNGVSTPGTVTVDKVNHAIVTQIGTVSNQDDLIIGFIPNYKTDDNEECLLGNPSSVTNA